MKLKRGILSAVLFFGFATTSIALAGAKDKVVVAVMDRPIDVSDARLKGKLDQVPQGKFFFPYELPQSKIDLIRQYNSLKQIENFRELTPAEVASKKQIRKVIKQEEFNEFIGYNHGQHVAGIVLAGTVKTKIVPVPTVNSAEQLNTKAENVFKPILDEGIGNVAVDPLFLVDMPSDFYGLKELRVPLYFAAKDTLSKFLPAFKNITNKEIQIVNMSYSMDMRSSIAYLVGDLYAASFFTSPSEPVWTKYVHSVQRYVSAYFYDVLMRNRDKLFVLAAGNWVGPLDDKPNDNDADPIFPNSVKNWYHPKNILLVAATVGRDRLAHDSGYGEVTVDVAAPGVKIESYAVGGGTIEMSGTSQAAPYVSNTAARMLEANPHLTTLEIKDIIVSTVDKKDFLKDKVSSGGIVNPDRAIYAANLRSNMELKAAVEKSLSEVADLK